MVLQGSQKEYHPFWGFHPPIVLWTSLCGFFFVFEGHNIDRSRIHMQVQPWLQRGHQPGGPLLRQELKNVCRGTYFVDLI